MFGRPFLYVCNEDDCVWWWRSSFRPLLEVRHYMSPPLSQARQFDGANSSSLNTVTAEERATASLTSKSSSLYVNSSLPYCRKRFAKQRERTTFRISLRWEAAADRHCVEARAMLSYRRRGTGPSRSRREERHRQWKLLNKSGQLGSQQFL